MKKIVLKLYEFDELSKDSQERIIEREHWNVMEQCMDAYGIDYNWSVQAESIMSVIKRSDSGHSAEAYDIDELKNNWNHWVRTGEILFTPGNGRW